MDIQAVRKTDTVPTLISQISRIKPLTEMKALLDAASDEDIAIGNLAQLIESVPVVAARVLAMAGSAYYGSIEAPRSVTDAIVRVLGMTQVRLLVVGFAANAAFKPEKCPGFDPERYWSSALLTAYLCRRLIAETKPRNSLLRPPSLM